MSFEVGQWVRVVRGFDRGATGEVIGKAVLGALRVRLDNGITRPFVREELLPISTAEEGSIGGGEASAEGDERQQARSNLRREGEGA